MRKETKKIFCCEKHDLNVKKRLFLLRMHGFDCASQLRKRGLYTLSTHKKKFKKYRNESQKYCSLHDKNNFFYSTVDSLTYKRRIVRHTNNPDFQ